MRRIWLLNSSCICLFVLIGCSALNIRMGRRVDLTKTPVASIEASLPKGPAIAPGQKLQLVVKVTQPDGKVLLTEGQGKGKVQWKDLEVTARVLAVNNNGVILLPSDPRVGDGQIGHVTVTIPSQPDVKSAELDVPFRYNIAFVSNFSGQRGLDGNNGLDGMDGIGGSMGSSDPNNPSPGSNGSDGTNGEDGKDGDRGGNAPDVDVLMTLQPGSQPPLLQVSVSALGQRRLYLVDPNGGSITVKADGGAGGSGGRGGRGGRGGSGGLGMPNGRDGLSGSDGRSGFDGPPGRGGLITVTYDPEIGIALNAIRVSSKNGPPAVFKERPVDPLW